MISYSSNIGNQSANSVSAILPHILRLEIWKIYSSFSLGHLRLEDQSQSVGHQAQGDCLSTNERLVNHMYLKIVD
jgi:hypothetical protein